ncbi:hypothetical protein D3C87_1737520 [compost metagenome]
MSFISGSSRRFSENTASRRMSPLRMCGMESEMSVLPTWMWPPSSAVAISPPPSRAT